MPDDVNIELGRFAVGQPVTRIEDPVLLRGEGNYCDDVNVAGQAWAVMVRSSVAHGTIRRVDVAAARAAAGVLGIYTIAELDAACIGPLPCNLPLKNQDGSNMLKTLRPVLARDRVRNVGEPIACVVAGTLAQARDAADLFVVDIDPLPAVADAEAAVKPGAPQLHDNIPGNIALDYRMGDKAAVDAAFAKAAHVTKLRLVNNRVAVSPMEPRSGVGEYDPKSERYTLHVCSQGVMGMRDMLASALLKVPPEKVRVLTGNVGGSFGMKAMPYPEYVCCLLAAKQLGRPVKWTADRGESFLSDHQGRGAIYNAELALDADGTFLAARVDGLGDMGAYLGPTGPLPQSQNIFKNLPSMYRTPAIDVRMRCVVTNTVVMGAYRGAGRPEGNYIMERLVDAAARETGRDPAELRRRNLVPAGAYPFKVASGGVYDSGEFETILDMAVAQSDRKGFAARKGEAAARGRKRGLGLACYVEVTAPPSKEHGGIRFDADGSVAIVTGTLDYGQGHASTFAQILSTRLGVPFDRIKLVQNDSDLLLVGGGTGGSRSVISSGGAIVQAAYAVEQKGKALAGHVLEAAASDIEFARARGGEGMFRIVGTDRTITLLDLAAKVRSLEGLPDELKGGLDVNLVHDTGPSAFPNGCHICEVEIDPDTGIVEVVRYTIVDDFGTVINPLLCEGQVHGGVVQGIGQALLEEVVYDDRGQLLTGSYMDYALPRAADVPDLALGFHSVPATTNVLGAKGAGEAGCTGALPAIMNAVVDALAADGVKHLDMPATPGKVWAALHAR